MQAMEDREQLPNLFKAECQKIISELRYLFAIEIETVEDLVSDTFFPLPNFGKIIGFAETPTAWLYTVATKNKARIKENS